MPSCSQMRVYFYCSAVPTLLCCSRQTNANERKAALLFGFPCGVQTYLDHASAGRNIGEAAVLERHARAVGHAHNRIFHRRTTKKQRSKKKAVMNKKVGCCSSGPTCQASWQRFRSGSRSGFVQGHARRCCTVRGGYRQYHIGTETSLAHR